MEHSGERGDLFDTNLGSLFGKQLFEIPFSALEFYSNSSFWGLTNRSQGLREYVKKFI